MQFTGKEGKGISVQKAKTLIKSFQNSKGAGKIKGGFYGKIGLAKILNQRGCVGIRYYHAVDAKKQRTIVLVGADKYGASMTKGFILEEGPLCPPWCDHSNALDPQSRK